MSDVNRMRISYALESTWATVPTGSYQDLRWTSESLKGTTDVKVSEEVRYDRQVADVFRGSAAASGAINFELSGAAFDDFLLVALGASAWSSPVTSTGTFSATGSNTFTRASGSWVTDGIIANQWVYVSGFANAANNGLFKVVTVAATTLTVVGAAATVVEAGSGDESIVMGAQIVNGTVLKSLCIEKAFLDIASSFCQYPGMSIESLNMKGATGEAITGTANFLGQKEAFNASSSGSGYTAAPSNPVLETVDHVAGVIANQTAGNVLALTDFDFTIATGLRNRMAIASLYPISQGFGSFEVSGSFKQYFSSDTQFALARNFTNTSLAILIQEASAPSRYVIDFPRIKITDAQRLGSGRNQDVMAEFTFTAYRHSSEGVTMRIMKI